jgi:hypothetical protein
VSHFVVWVLTEGPDDDRVADLLAPYDENGEWFADGSRWDWWVVGGRWTGMLDPDYDPREDPRNTETCFLCEGTGRRPDADTFGEEWIVWSNGCNGCMGKGTRLAWAFVPFDGDRKAVPDVDVSIVGTPLALVTPDGRWHERARSGWFGIKIEDENGEGEKPEKAWEGVVLALLDQHPDSTITVVDCHV